MMAGNFIIVGLLFLHVQIYNFQDTNKDDISLNYEFDYHSNVEGKNSSSDYSTLLTHDGKIETSAYLLTDKQELLLLKLKIFGTGKFLNETSSITSIVIRKAGLVERIVIDDLSSIGMINLLKGAINLFSLDEMRENKTEPDISGECTVNYNLINDNLLLKEKTNCNKTIISSFDEPDIDSFSLYKESKINTYYSYNSDGALLSIKSIETHSFEPVLFQSLTQEYKSTTTIKFKKLTKSHSLISSASLENVIRTIFGNKYREVFLLSTPEISQFHSRNNKHALARIQTLIKTHSISKRSRITLDLINEFRKVTDGSLMSKLMKNDLSKDIKEILIDSAISCGTKICSEMVLREFERCIKKDKAEANRILIFLQNIRLPNEFIVKNLWPKIEHLTGELFHQAIQTICSLVEISRDSKNLEQITNEIINFITNKISSCKDNECFSIYFSAIKNNRNEAFRHKLLEFIINSGNYSSNAVADALNTIWILRYSPENEIKTKKEVIELIKTKINFLDPYIQYHSINCLVMLQIDTDQLITILNDLQINNSHYQYFLIKKLEEFVNLSILKDSVLESKFFLNSKHMFLTYSENDGSKMLVKPLFTTDNSLMDIHFNMIGSDGGVIKHTTTDLFLLSTVRENNLFSFSAHMSGLQSLVGSSSENTKEDVEGLLQISLFGKLAKPITLFRSTSELLSMFWNAPSELESILKGTLVPINSQNEIHFQNGIVLMNNFMGSVFLDFSFQLSTSIWYKTADSLLRTTGNVYARMESKMKSLFKSIDNIKELQINTGIDFSTNTDFGKSPMKSCMSVSRSTSKMQFNSRTLINKNKTIIDQISENTKINGLSYSITSKMDQLCGML